MSETVWIMKINYPFGKLRSGCREVGVADFGKNGEKLVEYPEKYGRSLASVHSTTYRIVEIPEKFLEPKEETSSVKILDIPQIQEIPVIPEPIIEPEPVEPEPVEPEPPMRLNSKLEKIQEIVNRKPVRKFHSKRKQ